MWAQQDVFNHAIAQFSSEQEEIRTAAAFAAGTYSQLIASELIAKLRHA